MFRKKKKRTFWQKCEADIKKLQKKGRKKLRKYFKSVGKSERRFRKLMKNGFRYMELTLDFVFVVVVLFLFWRKAKDPDFLNDFGATKL